MVKKMEPALPTNPTEILLMTEPSGQGGFQPRFTITHAITAHLTRIERARGFLEAAELSAEWLKAMEQRALQSVRENDMDMTGWLEYFTEGLATQLAEVRARGEKVISADLIAKKYRLNPRQSKAMLYVLEHGKINIQDYERLFSQVAKRTLQRDLQALVQKNVLSENASSPTDPGKWYSLSDDVKEKL